MTAAGLLGGYASDLAVGDPRRWHPVAGYGKLAIAAERVMYRPTRAHGVAYTALLVGLPALGAEALARAGGRRGRAGLLAAVTWAALGGRSLAREGDAIAGLIERGDLGAARLRLPALAGRDATHLDEAGLCRAVVESLAENTSDAVVGTLLWGTVAGPAGVVAFRAANTLDAMVGHRSERYESFGWAAARLDDALGWPAARGGAALTAACAPLVQGSARRSLATLRRDGAAHPSPNAGRMEAAFAGALGVGLGGPLSYGGRVELRPVIGAGGRTPRTADVRRAVRLSLAVGAASAGGCALLAQTVRAAARTRR